MSSDIDTDVIFGDGGCGRLALHSWRSWLLCDRGCGCGGGGAFSQFALILSFLYLRYRCHSLLRLDVISTNDDDVSAQCRGYREMPVNC